MPGFIRINPMLRKELLISMRTIKMTIMMIVFNTILGIIGLAVFNSILENVRWSGSIDYSSTIVLYITLIAIQFGLLVIIVPAMTVGAITGERERQTLDILLSTTMTPFQILLGKLLSSIIAVVLLLLSSLPVLSLIFIFGGVSFGYLLSTVLLLIFTTVYAGVIGLSCSVRFKKTTTATVCAYLFILLIGAGTLFIVGIAALITGARYPYEPNVGPLSWLLLFNPGLTLTAFLMNQVGIVSDFADIMTELGIPLFIARNWVVSSLTVQTGFIAALMLAAVKRLNPIKRKGKR